MRSMTGYGKGEASVKGWCVTGEIKSVNHRYLSLHIHISPEQGALEPLVNRAVKEVFSRGRIDVYLNIQSEEASTSQPQIQEDLLQAYRTSIQKVMEGGETVSLEFLLSLPGVLEAPAGPEAHEVEDLVLKVLKEAQAELLQMQEREGEYLRDVLNTALYEIRRGQEILRKRLPLLEDAYVQRLKQKVGDLVDDLSIDEERLLQEVAIMADRSDIREEMDRLESHLFQFQITMDKKGTLGKKLDFIAQEMQRELNTMGSKIGDSQALSQIIDMKGWVERIREQVQNIL